MIMVSLVTSVTIQNYYGIISYVLYKGVYYIPMTYVFYNWNFVHLNPLHLLIPTPSPLPSGNHPLSFCIFKSISDLFFKFHV